MSSGRRRRYADVVATVALVLAVGGGAAYAIDKIGAKQIAKNAVRAKHIKAGQVKGDEVDEGSLGSVPLADAATTAGLADRALDADSVGGVREKLIRASLPAGAPLTLIDTVGGLRSTSAATAPKRR